MKGKFSSIWRLTLALALVLTLVLVMAAPVAASGAVTVVWAQLSSYTASATGVTYNVHFTTGHALAAGFDTITVLFPVNTVPTDAVTVTVDPDGDAVAATTGTATAHLTGYRLEVTTPVDIALGSEVRLDIPTVKNPSTTDTNYTLNVYTSQETTLVESSTYRMGATSVSAFTSIAATTTSVAGAASLYTITFTKTTSLVVGNTITVVFPTGTTIPAMVAADVTIDSTVLTAAPVIAGRFVTLTTPVDITDAGKVIVFLITADIKNPTYASTTKYGAKIYTSKDLGIVSQSLTGDIVAGPISHVDFKDVAGVVDSEHTVMVSTTTPLVTCYATLTIETRDQYDNPKAVAENTVFDLTSSASSTGSFSIDHSTWTATSVTMTSAAATKVFYYKDTVAGNATIRAREHVVGTLTNTWDIEVTSGVVRLYDGVTVVGTYGTIQAALADALPGNVIKVGPGTYTLTSTLDISKDGLTLESTGGAAVTIITSTVSGGPTISIYGDDVTFKGFTLKDLVADQWGIWIHQYAARATVKDNIFTGTTANNHAAITLQGEYADGSVVTGATISGNDISGTKYGINILEGGIHNTISGNTITGLTGSIKGAIWLTGGLTGYKTHGNTISGNIITDNAGYGINIMLPLTRAAGGELADYNYLDDNVIGNNTISRNAKVGIKIDSALNITKLVISGNDITDNGGVGIEVGNWTAASNAIKFNNISDNDTTNGYGLQNTSAIAVDATHNWWGTAVASGIADLVHDTSTGVTSYDPWLGASVSEAKVALNSASLDAQAEVGVTVSGATETAASSNAAEIIGAALYTANPKATFTALENGFFDVYVRLNTSQAWAAADEVVIKFYAGNASSVVYTFGPSSGTWDECTLQGFSSHGGYIWVKVHSLKNTTAPTTPTLEDLTGTPFAISGAVSTIALVEDWNFISVPKRMTTSKDTFGELLTGISYTIAWSYSPAGGWVQIGNSTSVAPLNGYWINVTTAGNITLSYLPQGQAVPPTKVLTGDAWNAIGHSSTSNLTAGDTLMSIADSWSTLIGWNAATQAYDAAIVHPGTGVSDLMLPGKGYWIWMTTADTLSAIGG